MHKRLLVFFLLLEFPQMFSFMNFITYSLSPQNSLKFFIRKLGIAKPIAKGEAAVATAMNGLVSGEPQDVLLQDAMAFTLHTGRTFSQDVMAFALHTGCMRT
jgi:hypothetical protein